MGLLFAFMPVLANNRSGGDVNHFDVLHTLFRRCPSPALHTQCLSPCRASPCMGCPALVYSPLGSCLRKCSRCNCCSVHTQCKGSPDTQHRGQVAPLPIAVLSRAEAQRAALPA